VPEDVHRRRVGEVVGRDVDGLDRGDRAVDRAADALLERRELGRERRLVAEPGRDAAHQPGHLGARLDEPEDVVDQQQHVAVAVVAEVLGHRQGRVPDPQAGAGLLVHLPEEHDGLVDHARLGQLAVELLRLAGALADAAEDRGAGVAPDHVVDHLHDQHGLADPGTAEQPGLAAALEGGEDVDRLDAGDQHLARGGPPCERDRRR
jgi:hypothetical protein